MHSTQEKMKKETKKKKKGINFGHIPISEQVVVMFPGQGSQYTGMGKKVIISVFHKFISKVGLLKKFPNAS